ncbi:hypothetical protein PPYR_03307 [Photinus pyralis]|uniref:Histone-lysine N-methyltransferase eggless n=1 Tax=Photinus pyralis TaxID=7054 RepID=A0A1Y1L596_PHOPY|nr:histone-lysine N-methyltransferase eggless [Photinus pyralis]KAB0791507.1 hypothetical protein PPYR_03307 [Photinus pyralis]
MEADEPMEEDDTMEMDIDETVPSTTIIENRRTSETITAPVAPQEEVEKHKPDDDVEIVTVPSEPTKPAETTAATEDPKPIEDDDVVILDDDEEPNTPTRTPLRAKPKATQPSPEVNTCEVIDLVDRKPASVNSKCINYSCKSGLDMIIAPLFCLTFYRVKTSKNKKQEVCKQCYDIALLHFDKLAVALKNDELLIGLDIPVRHDLVEIDDSDSDDENDKEISEYFDAETMEFLEKELENVMRETMEKYKISEQTNNSVVALKKTGAEIKAQFQEVDTMLHNVRKQLDTIHHNLYSEFKVRYDHLPPLDIGDVYCPTARTVTRSPSVSEQQQSIESERRSLRRTKPISYVELDDPGSASNSPVVGDSTTKDGGDGGKYKLPPADLPPKGPLQKPPLKIGEYYYTVRFMQMGSWIRVRLINIIKPGTIINGQAVSQVMYCVSMENKQQSKYPTNRLVTGKEIAYSFPSPVTLEVGTRVIAIFRETYSNEVKKMRKESYYPGIIAEPLSFSNDFRYLIFFDDGYAQYVHHKMVHLIYESSKDVWEDMHVDSRLFIKKYLESYPERPMVRLRKDQTVRTEYNGKWCFATAMAIDCSLVKMFFETSNRIEWIYRGSTRLNPMFKEEQAASNRHQNKARVLQKLNDADSGTNGSAGRVRSVARKSTARATVPHGKIPPTVPFLPVSSNEKPTLSLQPPPPSKVVYFTPRAQVNTKTVYKPHVCSIKCKALLSYDVKKLNGYNPLSKPLLCGWNRVSFKHKGNKKDINYKAPCGRFIRNMEELHKYLRVTQSEMTVDLFDFDFWVHCLAEFVLERNATVNKDMSNGVEIVTIPIVNYVDNNPINFSDYSNKREPKKGVHLNTDPEFLCGCDCTDDCEDKLKCQCWQLTLQGLRYINKNLSPDNVGYLYRRLPEPVATGIYECNSRCKCAATCLNRVVQNPLQLKLQVFKTINKGWGIRCLNDIPQGAFICIYAGSILTEQMANEGGKNAGDEYLAELDYIEVVEKMKEDYEEDAMEDDDEEDKESSKSGDESPDEDFGKNTMDDRDFVPPILVPKGQTNSAYKKRLRKRTAEDAERTNSKDDEEETVIVSDDEEDCREPSRFNVTDESNMDDDSQPSMYKSVREMFGKEEAVYIMDAKIRGNIGRFLNHSCSPNVFVQNVFVDTHDLRFPWVAFFALTYIRAGTELTWNYNYDVGSVPGKVLYCYCASQECRGRLL